MANLAGFLRSLMCLFIIFIFPCFAATLEKANNKQFKSYEKNVCFMASSKAGVHHEMIF